MEEVQNVVWEFDGNKCPGPNGYNFSFIRKCWNTLSSEIFAFVSEFYTKENLPKAVSASFIALIPKKLIKIQREFLWCGGSNSRGISWVSWSDVCKSKETCDLGIKCLEAFNESLICKWKWRFHVDKHATWRPLLEFRYGSFIDCVLNDASSMTISKSSLWWRDIISNSLEVSSEDWFHNGINCVLGNGCSIKFWKSKWFGPQLLSVLFSTAFSAALNKDIVVANMGVFANSEW
ncbi:uncharacterized mitochondrial protein AtMg00310-like [Vicia villosa]|uniref:uncharacterized mitochondrial protein AtMg00310-like n=1 Tax=Vicia villosa TaxID=3911 RepID=UPI00273C09F0|nr:uncharacterized mitochondrial protein AtMg00310-like [Vicia villosa]